MAANAGLDATAISSGRAVALFRVRMAIESRLSDSTLDPEAVASAAGVSVRYANGLLAEQGMSLEQVKAAKLTRDFDPIYGSDTGRWTTDMFIEAAQYRVSVADT